MYSIPGFDVYSTIDSTDEELARKAGRLGECRVGRDGIGDEVVFRFCKAGAVNIAANKYVCEANPVANHSDIAAVVTAAGTKLISVTNGGTALTANQYANGTLAVIDGPGEGEEYTINSHPAADASAVVVITVKESLRTALTTSSKINLKLHPCDDVVISPTDAKDVTLGATVVAVTASYYFWALKKGRAMVTANGTVTKATPQTLGGADGTTKDQAAGEAETKFTTGAARDAATTGEQAEVYINV